MSALFGLALAAVGQPTFQGLGDLPGGKFNSNATAVSADGHTVAGGGVSAAGSEACIWTKETGLVGLGDLPEGNGKFGSGANGISGDGLTVVGVGTGANGSEAFRWTAQGGMKGLGHLPGDGTASLAYGVSADGSVVVGFSSSTFGLEAIRWTEQSGMVGLGSLKDKGGSLAYATSADGTVVVGWTDADNSEVRAFRWTSEDGMVSLGVLPGANGSTAEGVSPDGSFAVGFSAGVGLIEAFLYADGQMIGLGWPPTATFASDATGVSADGTVVVGAAYTVNSEHHAFIWISGVNHDLKDYLLGLGATGLEGWSLTGARAITPDGNTIVGVGVNPCGEVEGWVASLSGGTQPELCYPDCDACPEAGALDLFDFLCFVNKFNDGDAYADCAADGALDLFDFLCFVNAFNAGC